MKKQVNTSKAVSAKNWIEQLGDGLQSFNLTLTLFFASTVGFWITLHQFSKNLPQLGDIKWIPVVIGIAVPLTVYFLLLVLPRWFRRWREEKLVEWAARGYPSHGYFRLDPYEEADRLQFDRPDGAAARVLEWLRNTSEPLLYLTGRSGTGKSSLISAYVLPNLRDGQPPMRTINIRTAQDPTMTLARELMKPGVIYTQPPNDLPTEILPLLRRVGDRLREKDERLLIVFDQFEEFLILLRQDPAQQAVLAELLQTLSREPINRIQILLVLRSDYQASLLEFGLPGFRGGVNWMEVGPFREDMARRFLEGSKLNLGPKLMEVLIRRGSELDETPGYVRPIVLNMLGQALEIHQARNGTRQFDRRDAERLLINYVHVGLRDPIAGDCAPAVLGKMVTPEGVRATKTVQELASQTNLSPQLVAGCLTRLAYSFGFVRQLNPKDQGSVEEQSWEVAHDFLARLLGSVLPGWRPSIWNRLRPWLAPAMVALAIMVIPLSIEIRRQYRLEKLNAWAEEYKFLLRETTADKYSATPPPVEGKDKTRPSIQVAEAIRRAVDDGIADMISELNLSKIGLDELPPEIGQFRELMVLNLKDNRLTKLPQELAQLQNLRILNLADNGKLVKVPSEVFQLTELIELDLARTNLEELPPEIGRLKKLAKLHLPRNNLKILPQTLGDLDQLITLHLSRNEFKELPTEIGKLGMLRELHVSNCMKLVQLPDQIGDLHQLRILHLSDNHFTMLPSTIGGLGELTKLDLRNNRLTELPGTISKLNKLAELDLRGNPELKVPQWLLNRFQQAGVNVHLGSESLSDERSGGGKGTGAGKGSGDGKGK